jgi:hypothetical protein
MGKLPEFIDSPAVGVPNFLGREPGPFLKPGPDRGPGQFEPEPVISRAPDWKVT